jgi:2-(3-amino-3-carboxypropyl)histidine synthase
MRNNSPIYELELAKAAEEVINANATKVLVQLADGLKPRANEIQEYLEKHTKAIVLIWGGTCFGACDIPLETKNLGVDLILQWGHCL